MGAGELVAERMIKALTILALSIAVVVPHEALACLPKGEPSLYFRGASTFAKILSLYFGISVFIKILVYSNFSFFRRAWKAITPGIIQAVVIWALISLRSVQVSAVNLFFDSPDDIFMGLPNFDAFAISSGILFLIFYGMEILFLKGNSLPLLHKLVIATCNLIYATGLLYFGMRVVAAIVSVGC